MATNPLIALQARAPNVGEAFSNVLLGLNQREQIKTSRQARGTAEDKQRFDNLVTDAVKLNALGSDEAKLQFARSRLERIKSTGQRDTAITDAYIQALERGDSRGAQTIVDKVIQGGQQKGVVQPSKQQETFRQLVDSQGNVVSQVSEQSGREFPSPRAKSSESKFQSSTGKLIGDEQLAIDLFGKGSPQARAIQEAIDSEQKGEEPKLTDLLIHNYFQFKVGQKSSNKYLK